MGISGIPLSLGKTGVSRDFLFVASSGPDVMLALKAHLNLLKGTLNCPATGGMCSFPRHFQLPLHPQSQFSLPPLPSLRASRRIINSEGACTVKFMIMVCKMTFTSQRGGGAALVCVLAGAVQPRLVRSCCGSLATPIQHTPLASIWSVVTRY